MKIPPSMKIPTYSSTNPNAPKMNLEYDGVDLFVCIEGKRIAKRGQPNTAHARTWIPLERG